MAAAVIVQHMLPVKRPTPSSNHAASAKPPGAGAIHQHAVISSCQLSPSTRSRSSGSSSGGLSVSVSASMGSAGASRYPPGDYDVGFSLLRAPKLILTDAERARLDEAPDAAFYASPRTMQHAEPQFIAAVTGVYGQLLCPGSAVLELCASCHSHLPAGLGLSRVVGQGMNAQELAGNAALSQWWVQDLNAEPLLLEQVDGSYDAVLCVNGLQYLTQPELVLTEAWRVLQPGGLLLVAFGSHCFPEKVTAGWCTRSMEQRTALATRLLQANGFDQVQVLDSTSAAQQAAAAAAGLGHAAGNADNNQQAAAAAAAAAPQLPPATIAAPRKSSIVEVCIVVATKPCLQPSACSPATVLGAAGAAAQAAAEPAAGGGMRPDNVAQWFTKPGLAGLTQSAAAAAADTSTAGVGDVTAAGEVDSGQQQVDVSAAFSEELLLQQWVASYEVLVGDAADLGIPRSVIPQLGCQPSAAEVQAAVRHLQAMVASFLSSGL